MKVSRLKSETLYQAATKNKHFIGFLTGRTNADLQRQAVKFGVRRYGVVFAKDFLNCRLSYDGRRRLRF